MVALDFYNLFTLTIFDVRFIGVLMGNENLFLEVYLAKCISCVRPVKTRLVSHYKRSLRAGFEKEIFRLKL